MTADVFISHSSIDKKIAEKIYDRLKSHGISCWISSRDIPAGADYQTCIAEAIEKSKVVVLVFSENANSSTEIAKELSLSSKKNLIPARIEDVIPQGSFQYQLSNRQFVDLFDKFDEKLDDLATRVQEFLASTNANVYKKPSGFKRKFKRYATYSFYSLVVISLGAGAFVLYPKYSKNSSEAPVESIEKTAQPQVKIQSNTVQESVASQSNQLTHTVTDTTSVIPAQKKESPSAATSASNSVTTPEPQPVVSSAEVKEKLKKLILILGDSTQSQRFNLIRNNDNLIPRNIDALDTNSLLRNTQGYRSQAIAMLAPYVTKNLPCKDISIILGDTSQADRLNAINSLSQAGSIANDSSADQMKLVLEGTGGYKSQAIAIVSPYVKKNLPGKDISIILDDTRQADRLNAIKSLSQAGSIANDSSADQMKFVLDGTGGYKSQAIAIVAPYVMKNLPGKDISIILGNTSQNDRFNAIKSLSQAGSIANDSSADQVKLVLEGTGGYKSQAIAIVAPYVKKNLPGKDISIILGDTSQADRLNSIKSLFQAGVITKNLSNADVSLILEGIGGYRAEAMKYLVI
ncbi:MAG: toll/interleukin-1 receptor domain-containing protein [Spirochaetales bacterium]|jgi:hypothetical protein|nr:toll/interleukin-1 receptor domain-containing protein [Spirochaetales bacterium]